MTDPRVIRIEAVGFDFIEGRFEGIAICRAANGVLSRHRCRAAGDPAWSHARAVRALTCNALA